MAEEMSEFQLDGIAESDETYIGGKAKTCERGRRVKITHVGQTVTGENVSDKASD